MAAALVVAHDRSAYLLLQGSERPVRFRVEGRPGDATRPGADPRPEKLPAALVRELEDLGPGSEIAVGGSRLAEAVSRRLGRPVSRATAVDWRRALRLLPHEDPATEGAYLRSVARVDLERALASPEEVLITLAREEERLERSVGREERAAESLLAVPVPSIAAYSERSKTVRILLSRHHAELLGSLEAAASQVVPNLSAVVGPRAAARLVAAAGGVVPLARFSAGRIQLLGTRRRPDPDRGPRYGLLYRAERVADVPPARRAAYARSLAALAAIAARADAWTRGSIGARLRERRDRRVDELVRGRR